MSRPLIRRFRHPAPGALNLIVVLVLAVPVLGTALAGHAGASQALIALVALLAIFGRHR
ncbi:MAG: hypothetical protein ACR2KV_12105 [Solirubrobacteraceae bacterium]